MAHYYAKIQGARGPASRLGSKQSGINATIAGWAGAVIVTIEHTLGGLDRVTITLADWPSRNTDRLLFSGTLQAVKAKRERKARKQARDHTHGIHAPK